MIVADVNIVVYLLTDTPQRAMASQLYIRDPIWVLPPLWQHELLNVLATLTRQVVVEQDSALLIWRHAVDLLAHREQQPNMEHALLLAIEHGISAYDAQYVALARELGVSLVSEDKKLQRLLPDQVVSLARSVADYQDTPHD